MAKLSETKELIRELAALLRETDLSEIEVEDDDFRIRVARGGASAEVAAAASQPAPTAPASATAAQPQAVEAAPAAVTESGEAAAEAEIDAAEHPGVVTSPMVGTAYASPEPGSDPFIKVGDTVTEGQTLLIIEAMKVMNPIPAPSAGKITRILFEDAQPIEFGQPLVIIE